MLRICAFALAFGTAVSAQAATININPIKVCDDLGSNCASVSTFSGFTNAIYAQRGDSVEFGTTTQYNSSKFLTIDSDAEVNELLQSNIFSGTGRKLFAYDMWFVNSLAGAYGVGALGGDGMIISNAIIPVNRVDTVAHELGHNIGFDHTAPSTIDAKRYLMADGSYRQIPTSAGDIAPSGLQLDRFDALLPRVSLDTIGSTPFANTGFFNVKFLAGSATDVSLTSLVVDLAPANAFTDPSSLPPGMSGSPFGFSNLNGVLTSDLSVSGIADGSQKITVSIAPGAFVSGDSFDFGVDIDLFSAEDFFGATADELRRAVVSFNFSNGYAFASALDDLVASAGSIDPTANYDKPALVIAEPEFIEGIAPVPESSTWAMMIFGFGMIGSALRFRSRAPSARKFLSSRNY